jgi:hypothetical protein
MISFSPASCYMCEHKVGNFAKYNIKSFKDVPIKNLFKLIYNSNCGIWKNGMHYVGIDFRKTLTTKISEMIFLKVTSYS